MKTKIENKNIKYKKQKMIYQCKSQLNNDIDDDDDNEVLLKMPR